MLFFHYGIHERAAIRLICKTVAALLGPPYDEIPVFPKELVLAGTLEKSRIKFCSIGQATQIVGIGGVGGLLIRKIEAAGLLRDARLQSALHRISGEVICAAIVSGSEKNLRLPRACGGQVLKILAIHPASVGVSIRKLPE
jgi:hypothetical protein